MVRESSRSETAETAPAPVKAIPTSTARPAVMGDLAKSLRPSHQRILDAFIAHGTMTPDELAEKISRSVFYTRPRCSEVRAMGLLHPTGVTRCNALSGLKATVLTTSCVCTHPRDAVTL